jgi:hypothetical protein
MADLSSSVAQNGVVVQAVHAGVNYAFAAFNSSGAKTPFSMSVSDAIVMMNLPRNSRIIAAYLGGIADDGNIGFSLGDPGSNTRYGTKSISATALSHVLFDGGAQGFAFSVSDDQTSYQLKLHVQNITSVTGSLSVHLGVLWVKV